tara:strand:- start:1131 stop:1625 length:495 start_codon:yes stop_codon:yes gene_type:complete
MCAPNPVDKAINYVKKKVVNTYKDVSGITAVERAAKEKQREFNRLAEQRRLEQKRLADARQATAAQQRAQLIQMEADQLKVIEGQKGEAAGLRAEQAEKLAGIRARGRAVTGSLKILAGERKTAPTAAVDTRQKIKRGAKTSQASLRIASQGAAGKGSGANISV